jgi:predicted Zn-dependent protease
LALGQYAKARDTLERARARDLLDGRILRDLGTAHAKTGNNGMASLSIAESYALRGRLKDASIHANRAAGLLPRGSAPWQRANDVLAAAKTLEKGKR